MGGSPDSWDVYHHWDNSPELCNFPVGTDVIAHRLGEDTNALSVLRCEQALPLGVPDIQYDPDRSTRPSEIRDGIEAALEQVHPATCFIPLGIKHFDHQEVRRLSLLIAGADPSGLSWLIYEELPYKPREEAEYQKALTEVRAGWRIEPVSLELDEETAKKDAAVACYGSQLNAVGEGEHGLAVDLAAEHYWQVIEHR